MGEWHDGHRLGGVSVFNPWSVINYLASGQAGGCTGPTPPRTTWLGMPRAPRTRTRSSSSIRSLGPVATLCRLARFYARSFHVLCLGFPASATQLRSSAGLDCHAVLIELLRGDVQPARPHHGEPIGPGGSELGGVGELLEDAVSDDFGHVIGTAAAVVKLKIERCVIYRPCLAGVVLHR